jgi:methionine biosynthesis protein MetW
MVLREMLRVGRQAIVSFSNWGHWHCRLELLFTGRVPVAVDLPQQWYETPRRQIFSVTDFDLFCRQIEIEIASEVYLNRGLRINTGRFRNLLSTTAVFTLRRRT